MTTTQRTGPLASDEDAAAVSRSSGRFRRRRLWVRWRRLAYAVLAASVLAVLAWSVFFSSLLAADEVEVRGVAVLTSAEVEQVASVPLGEPLARIDLAPIQARVQDLAPVLQVRVYRGWPDRVVIEITERSSVAAVRWDGTWRGVDADGVMFRRYASRPGDLPRLNISADTTIDALAEAAAVVAALPSSVQDRLLFLDVGSIDAISLTLTGPAGPIRVAWGSAESSTDKAAVLQVLLASHDSDDPPVASYDVTAPGRPTILPIG